MIRQAKLQDAQAILDIYNDAILTTTAVYKYEVETLQDRQQWLELKEQQGFPVFVYEEEGQVIGFATYGPFRPFPAYQYTIEHSVYIHKEHHQKGIGSQLMKRLIATANSEGYATMIGAIDASNIGSIRAHEKLGFTYVGTIQKSGFKFGKWLDMSFYQLLLDGPINPIDQ